MSGTKYINTYTVFTSLRCDDDMNQLSNTAIEGTVCNGGDVGRYGHIGTAAAGGAVAVHSR